MIERRLVEVTVGDESFYHLDKAIGQEYLNAFENESFEVEEKTVLQVNKMEKLWSDDPPGGHQILNLKLTNWLLKLNYNGFKTWESLSPLL